MKKRSRNFVLKHLTLAFECMGIIFQKPEREEIQAMPWWLKD